MIRLVLPAAVALVMTGACTPKTPPEAIPGVECNASKLGDLVGKTRSPEVEAEALKLSGAKTVRWLTPESMMTMDFRPDRLNLHLGTDGKIGSARCG
ncbi:MULTISPECIES: I78 family peptidase inhibitor [unclassified Sphingomonas]|uniref:I78 family peptidase inhibitor n=1 Tax=unclassified Sphingomonas TaxID=196159 RepID=UPI0022B4E89B|nr:I78 family peptidase inhibitor [Sphingomonas sp. NIBR02145]WHU03939.1 I78 family peptidase inhibitor [Sphingomonas sp. NIBR02145]